MVIIWLMMVNNILVGGFNLPLWKMMEFVNWDDDYSQYMEKNVWNHQPVFLFNVTGFRSHQKEVNHGNHGKTIGDVLTSEQNKFWGRLEQVGNHGGMIMGWGYNMIFTEQYAVYRLLF